jgi:hypothetical protein
MIEVRKDGEMIKISFPYDPDHIAKIKAIEGYRWHPEAKCWSLPYSELKELLALFNGDELDIDPSIWLDALGREMTARKYSPRTIKGYLYHNRAFLKFFKKDPYAVSNETIRDYLYYLAKNKEVSTSTLNIAINALKFYCGEVLKRRFVYEIRLQRIC